MSRQTIKSFVIAVIEQSKRGFGNMVNPLVCFCLPLETYHIHLSSITACGYMRLLEYNDFMLDKKTPFLQFQ